MTSIIGHTTAVLKSNKSKIVRQHVMIHLSFWTSYNKYCNHPGVHSMCASRKVNVSPLAMSAPLREEKSTLSLRLTCFPVLPLKRDFIKPNRSLFRKICTGTGRSFVNTSKVSRRYSRHGRASRKMKTQRSSEPRCTLASSTRMIS